MKQLTSIKYDRAFLTIDCNSSSIAYEATRERFLNGLHVLPFIFASLLPAGYYAFL